jgi:mycothiol system anti-sigma-R factor
MKLGLSCSETVLRLDDYIDRELSPTELARVEGHLLECVSCARKFGFEVSLMDALRRRLGHMTVPDDLLERIRERLASLESPCPHPHTTT